MEQNRILIVEDEAIVALDLRGILTSLGHDVVGTADTGQKALDLAREEIPDIVLMDIVLKGEMDGIEVAQILIEEMGVPIIFLTASGDDVTWKSIMQVRPAGYVHKPYDLLTLKFALESAWIQSQFVIEEEHRHRKEIQPMLDRISVPVILFKRDGTPRVANQAFYTSFGWGAEIIESAESIFACFLYEKVWTNEKLPVRRDIWSWVRQFDSFCSSSGEVFQVDLKIHDCCGYKALIFDSCMSISKSKKDC